jgi:membrane-associated phospholipid phosphatase
MVSRVKVPLAACIACGGALLLVVVLAYAFGPAETLDAKLLTHFGASPSTNAYEAAHGLARLADPLPLLVMLAAVVAIALSWGGRREALAAVVVVAGANVTTQLLKALLAHPRYQPDGGAIEIWSDAFPSGHATAAASIAVAMVLAAPPRVRPLAALTGAGFAFAVGIALVVLQWHFASDVLGGYLVVAAWGFAALAALRLVNSDAGGGTRTHKPARAVDFESTAYANSATPARGGG